MATFASMYTPETVLLSLLLASCWARSSHGYYFTHSGLSYSKSFVQSLILITVVISMVIPPSPAVSSPRRPHGRLSIIRFRNMIDTRHRLHLLFTRHRHGRRLSAIHDCHPRNHRLERRILYLYLTDFGKHKPHNGFLRFSLTDTSDPSTPFPMRRFCRSFTLISAQDGDFEPRMSSIPIRS